jgi:proliferating cell nuclear antigen
MLVKLDNPKILTDAISIISELVTEVKMKVSKEGLSIVAVDPANVALVSFVMPSTSFSALEADNETIGISLDNFKSVLKRSGPGSSLIMQTDENGLRIEIHEKIKRNFNVSLINIEGEDKKLPELDFTSFVKMNSDDFVKTLEDCGVVADSCNFEVKNGKFSVEAKGLHSTKSEFSSDEVEMGGGEAKSKYSLSYLQKFARACRLSDKCKIFFSNDYPMKLEVLGEGKNLFEMSFVLAPRVENEN